MLTPTLAIALQAPPEGGSMALLADLALVVIAVAIVAVAIMSGMLMLRFNRILSEVQRSTRQNFGPVSDRARSISANVEFITQALRTDVEKLNASVRSLSDRLQQASDRMEERVEEFNALMAVVQDEAEDIFLDTASTVRGVKEGARAISGGPRRGPGGRPGPRDGTPATPAATDAAEAGGSGTAHPPGPSPADGRSQGAPTPERAPPSADDRKAVSAGED